MSNCANFNNFAKLIQSIDQLVTIDKIKDKEIRYDVWGTTVDQVKNLFSKGVRSLPWDKNSSSHIQNKIINAIKRIDESTITAKKFIDDIINDDNNIENSIAIYELMETVKGEADKARNLDIEVSKITTGILPAVPMSRLAASVGRKILYQKGFRFKSIEDSKSTSAEIEALYYAVGQMALENLQSKGYVTINSGLQTIKDYIEDTEVNKERVKTNVLTDINSPVKSVSINESSLNIKTSDSTADYFLNRSESDLENTELGVVTDILRAIRQITQASTIELPDRTPTRTMKDLAERDDPNVGIDPETEAVRKKLYDTPLYVNKVVHQLMQLLNKESSRSGKSATQIVKSKLGGKQKLLNSLFGLKESDNFSIDKKESIAGQNLSKTAPFDDLVEYYEILQGGSPDPVALHMALTLGRNERMYYENSVLNPHGSKQSRYMLTSGEYSVDTNSDDFDYLVYAISQAIGDNSITYNDIVESSNGNIQLALELLDRYNSATTWQNKLAPLTSMSNLFPGVDYVTLLTSIQAIKDIRNPVNGKVLTEFQASADATASGGTLTFLQALSTNPNVKKFLESIGLLTQEDGSVKITLNDLYGLMSESISKYSSGEFIDGLVGQDVGNDTNGVRSLMKSTVNLLFDEGNSVREFSKDPTMTFIYGQKRAGASLTMAKSIADRIIDDLENPNTRKYLAKLFDDKSYEKSSKKELIDTKNLYKDITVALKDSGLTDQLFDLMDITINEKYLENFKTRSDKVFEFVKNLSDTTKFKILPAAAKMAGIKPTIENLKKYGMPLTKVVEVSSQIPNSTDTVLTRVQKLMKTVADVSTIHSIDAAQMYGSLKRVIGSKGIVVIHDDVRGTVQDVRAMESAYRDVTKDIVKQYDVHQAILKAVAAYDPSIAETDEYNSLMAEIQADVDSKARIIDTSFNNETDALIGGGAKYKEFKNKESRTESTPKTGTSSSNSAEFLLESLSSESEIIKNFLNSENRSTVTSGKSNKFIPSSDTIEISSTDIGRGAGRKLNLENSKDKKLQIELIEHEITHANTVAQIQKSLDSKSGNDYNDVIYFEKSYEQAFKTLVEVSKNNLEVLNSYPDELYSRLNYIMTRETQSERIAEFVSILYTEEEVATGIYKILGKSINKTMTSRIKDFMQRVVAKISSVTSNDLKNDVDVEVLYGAITRTIDQGISFREQRYKEAKIYMDKFNAPLSAGQQSNGYNDPKKHPINYLNYAVASMLNSKLERRGKILVGNLHQVMKDVFPLYSDAVNKASNIYNESEALQQIVNSITGEGTNKVKKADLLALSSKILANQTATVNDQIGKFNKLLEPLSKSERETVGRFVTEMPLHDYFTLASDFTNSNAIAFEVVKLEKEIKSLGQKRILKDIESLVDWNINGIATGNKIYNLESGSTPSNGDLNILSRKLLALKSIQAIGVKDFEKLLKNTDLVNIVKDSTVANKLSLIENAGESLLPDSGIMDYYKESFTINTIEIKDLKRYENGESTGWKILTMPTANTMGVIYKPIIDSTGIIGAYTDIKLNSTGIAVQDKFRGYAGVVKTVDGYKLRLNKEQKLELGLVKDFSQSLVRSVAHNMAIQESQVIRDALILKSSRIHIGKDVTKILDIVKSSNVDNPWFIKLEDDMEYLELPKAVRDKYKPVANRASNVKGFDEKISLVRKDISHWLLGGSASSLFENPQYKWVMRIVKDLIASSKIGMVVLNPIKIVNDNISNISYLGVMGVSPFYIAKNYKEISTSFQSYSDIQRRLVQLKIQIVANPDSKKIRRTEKALQKLLSRNSLNNLSEKGFINSLGSDIVAKNADTLSGLQSDVHTALEYLTTNKKGNKNHLATFITKLQNTGANGEDFLYYLGNISKRFGKNGKGMKQELDQVADRLKEIRTEEDVINYVSQYINSPASEAVRFGASMTDLTDIMAKETLFRHLVTNEGMSESDARIKVLDSFPDYKENMPLAIKQLSDIGIIMFPSFWLRIQKVIYRMVKDKPINLATELLLEEAFESNINTILDANIINKSESFGGLIHPPGESIGVGSVFPTYAF